MMNDTLQKLATASATHYPARMTSTRGPARRTRGTATDTVPLYVRVDPAIKDVVDRYAATAHRNPWEVVTMAVRMLQATEGSDGLPAGLQAQPVLDGLSKEVNSAA